MTPNGGRLLLTPEIAQRITDSVEVGNTERIAALSAGISPRSMKRYMERGRTADTKVTEWLQDQPENWLDHHDHQEALTPAGIPETEWLFWNLWHGVLRARARSAERAIANIREAGAGYESRVTRTTSRQVMHPKTGQVVTLTDTVVEVKEERDWRAEAWYAERAEMTRDDFVRVQRFEHTGQGGGPIELETAEVKREKALEAVSRVRETREQREEAEVMHAEAQRTLEASDPA